MHNNNTNEMTRIPEITTEELRTAINKLRKDKSLDSIEIRAEDIKACDDETREMVRQIFNEIIKQNEFTPEAWKKVKIKVIYKKGDVVNVGNSRPICSLPALYRLFTTILYSRLYPRFDQKQAEDQAGFRSSYQTTDHLATSPGKIVRRPESDMFEIKKGTKLVTQCQACSSTRFCKMHWNKTLFTGKREEGCLGNVPQ